MVLMGMLSLLGVMFYTFSAQERSNAEYYSEAAKEFGEPSLDADVLFDFALEQIIVGTNPQFKNSMLWGSRHSLLSNALGFGLHKPGDLHPFNGEGVNVIEDAAGNVAVDQNRNGKSDDGSGTPSEPDNRYLLLYNDSPAAQNEDFDRDGTLDTGEDLNNNGQLDVLTERSLTDGTYPQSDVGYTYPDINNTFLCYVGKVRDQNGNVHRVVKPSYMVPGILRMPEDSNQNSMLDSGEDRNGNMILDTASTPLPYEDTNKNGILDGGEDTNGNGVLDDWSVSPRTVSRIMRSHPNHLFVPANPSSGVTVNRYLTSAEATAMLGPSGYGFPFKPMADTYRTAPATAPTGTAYLDGKMGAYSKLAASPPPYVAAPADDPIEFDYDNDGDGIRESILMDLGHCVRSDASGNKYVPLFLITVHELDSLVNLNAHGNLAKILYGPGDLASATTAVSNSAANPFGWDTSAAAFYSVSQSNLGMGPSEINPFWALNARYSVDGSGSIFNQHTKFFGVAPRLLTGANPPWGETANMELLWSKIGRPQYEVSTTTIQEMYPGVYGEEGRLYQALIPYGGGSVSSAGGQSLPRPGTSLQDDNGDFAEGQAQPNSATNPYASFQHPLDYTGLGSYLSSSSPKQLNWYPAPSASPTDPNRWVAYSRYGSNIATPSASSNVKWGQKSGLMTNTLTQASGDDPQEVAFYAEDKRDIDKVFTPDEMLYLQLSNADIGTLNVSSRLSKLLPFNFASSTADNSRGQAIRKKFTTLSNDRKSFGLPTVASSATYGREWEFSSDPTSGKYTFPPHFGTIARFATTALAEDPFRRAVRYLLEIEKDGTQPTSPRLQRRLSLNQLLTGASSSQMEFRSLTPHPEDPGAATIARTTTYPPTTSAEFEYWARRDRQQMARDIYVLLYLLGHGDDDKNTATAPNVNDAVYDSTKLAEMAQFAVNLVDSMDRDNVMTRFEYDTDLNNGWNLDDDAYTASGESDRAEVFGIERLDLTISEVLAIKALKASAHDPATTFGDITDDQHFVYVELRNHGPFDITFDNKEAWQIVMKQDAIAPNPSWERRLSLKSGSIASGAVPYVIGSTDTDDPVFMFKKSTFGVDPAGGTGHVQIAPDGKDCDLDLIEATPASSYFRIQDETGLDLALTPPGAFLNALTAESANNDVTFLLRRRSHPTRTIASTESDNPWITVDTFELTANKFHKFNIESTSDTLTAKLQKLKSRERSQPLDGSDVKDNDKKDISNISSTAPNTLGGNNLNSYLPPVSPATMPTILKPFDIWQHHFDRDFASVMDLLYLPIFGPDKITTSTKDLKNKPASATSAAARFLDPGNTTNSNRWHRLLEFLEVPTRTNRSLGIGTDLSIPRVPGRMNLNTLRFADNFAALLDDSRNLTFKIDGTDLAGAAYHQVDAEAGELYDQFDGTNRNWWDQFLKSRDPVDPYWSTTVSVPLPGLPGSKPFRSLAHLSSTSTKTNSVEDTILRSLPADTAVTDKRGLFEIGTATEHSNGTVDPFVRNRLLAKIAGNTTPRSNSFAIFVSVKYFQAVEDRTTNPAVPATRIGGPFNGLPSPEHRGFFIVDRSKLEKGQSSGGTRYDFRDFIEYRKTLQTQ